ncbi:MAG: oxidoreductase [Nitrospinaceae bacterium]|nr:MAG: oxidoreductase [Nitrospinaceae bacterium]
MPKKLNVALIGGGYWGKNLARALNQLGVLRVVCDPSEDILKVKKDKYPNIETSTSFSETMAREDIESLVIATPAAMHYSMVKDALLAGKHVFVEKPLALTEKEGCELSDLAEKTGNVLFVGHILHYHPAIGKIKEMLDSGELGKIQYIYSNRLNLGKFRKEENILWSFAPHDISIILSLVNEEPYSVKAVGSSILHPRITDTTLTHLKFPSGVSAHIFVSWLHPFKEQKLVVIGDRKMVVFDDTVRREEKLVIYPHNILWQGNMPVPEKKEGVIIDLAPDWKEPLITECQAFLDGIEGKPVVTDGKEGIRVLKVLQQAQASMGGGMGPESDSDYFVHESSYVDEECTIGKGTKIWHYSHILKGSKIGNHASIGQNVVIGPNGLIGNNVKIQNNVSVYEGVVLEDDVFCGPSCVFTNVINPRSAIPRKDEFKTTIIRRGTSIGANATIICGNTIGKFAFIGAGSVVTSDVPDFALVLGNPAKTIGWMCECGERLEEDKSEPSCLACGRRYILKDNKIQPAFLGNG